MTYEYPYRQTQVDISSLIELAKGTPFEIPVITDAERNEASWRLIEGKVWWSDDGPITGFMIDRSVLYWRLNQALSLKTNVNE